MAALLRHKTLVAGDIEGVRQCCARPAMIARLMRDSCALSDLPQRLDPGATFGSVRVLRHDEATVQLQSNDGVRWSLQSLLNDDGTVVIEHTIDDAKNAGALLAWRARRLAHDLGRIARQPTPSGSVLLAGASGLVGTQLALFLQAGGWTVRRLVRRTARAAGEFSWSPSTGELDRAALDGVDVVVNLAGAGIADKRWTAPRKQLLHSSRVDTTTLLAAAVGSRPLVNASAVGFYGDWRGKPRDENAHAGEGFLASTCVAWERASDIALDAGARVVLLRMGVVVAHDGGALAKLLPIARCGLLGRLGNGRQPMEWIARDDLLAVVLGAMTDQTMSGPVNVVAPERTTNESFTKSLGHVLHRPTVLPMPAFAARLMFGELGKEALLSGAAVAPAVLQDRGFQFECSTLDDALRFELML